MQTNATPPLRPEKSQLPPHDCSLDTDDASIDAGAAENAQEADGRNPGQPQRISREAAEKGLPLDADPDDPVSP